MSIHTHMHGHTVFVFFLTVSINKIILYVFHHLSSLTISGSISTSTFKSFLYYIILYNMYTLLSFNSSTRNLIFHIGTNDVVNILIFVHCLSYTI